MKQRPLVIEFLGLPASGKSTLSHAAADALRRHGMPVAEPTYVADHVMTGGRRYLHKLGRVSNEVLCRPRGAASALSLVARSGQRHPVGTLRRTANWLFAASLLRRPADAPVQLVDEGVCQALWSIAYESAARDRAELLVAIMQSAPLPDAVVIVEVDPGGARRRLARRKDGRSRMDGAAGQTAAAWRNARRALSQTRRVLEEIAVTGGRPLLLPLRNDDPDQVASIAEWLAALVLSADDGRLRPAPSVPWPWDRAAEHDLGAPMLRRGGRITVRYGPSRAEPADSRGTEVGAPQL